MSTHMSNEKLLEEYGVSLSVKGVLLEEMKFTNGNLSMVV